MLIELEQGVLVSTSSNIKHKTELWLKVFANTLEEPTMRVDLTIVTVLYAEANVHASSLQIVFVEAHIPCCDLPDME